MKGAGHFDVRNIEQSSGSLKIMLTAIPRGYSEKPKIIGRFEAPLTSANAGFNLHCFLEPNGRIQEENRLLNWKIDAENDLIFE